MKPRGWAVLVLTLSCAGRSLSNSSGDVDASTGTVSTDSGIYSYGSGYTCCGAGQGVSCCTADAGLLGYDVEPDGAIVTFGGKPAGSPSGKDANCFQYGGASGACTAVGQIFDGKDICAICCEGLTRVEVTVVDDAGACSEAAIGAYTCTACGDGVCGTAETSCNCFQDCGK